MCLLLKKNLILFWITISNKNPTFYEENESVTSKLTPGLPPALPMPSAEFKNDFFNLSSYSNPISSTSKLGGKTKSSYSAGPSTSKSAKK